MASIARSSGVQLHITSLPDGRLGRSAYEFVDWLADAGQTWWQVLPVGPPDRYHSPYKSRSAFAAWPGLLSDRRAPVSAAEVSDLRSREAYWVEHWAKAAGRGAIEDQVRFEREWGALRRYGAERGVRLFGDIAIYVAPASVDHRAHPELFEDRRGRGRPARRLLRGRAAVGQPAVRLAGAASSRLSLVGGAATAHARAVRPRADRPFPRLRVLLGRARGRSQRRWRHLAPGTGAGIVRRRRTRARRRACRWSPRTSA